MSSFVIFEFEEVVQECQGCDYKVYSIILKKYICSKCRCPASSWRWDKCPDAIEGDKYR